MIYLYDGSFEGLLTCVFEAYASKERDASLKNKFAYIPSFLMKLRKLRPIWRSLNGCIHRSRKDIPPGAGDYLSGMVKRG